MIEAMLMGGLKGMRIKSIQQGVVYLADTSQNEIPINAVDPSKSIVLISQMRDTTLSRLIGVNLSRFGTNGDVISMYDNSDLLFPVTIQYTVIEFTGVRGFYTRNITMDSGVSELSGNVTSIQDISKCTVFLVPSLGVFSAEAADGNLNAVAEFSGTNTITVKRNPQKTADAVRFVAQIVEAL